MKFSYKVAVIVFGGVAAITLLALGLTWGTTYAQEHWGTAAAAAVAFIGLGLPMGLFAGFLWGSLEDE